MLLSLALLLASILADSLSRPLQELAAAATRIESEGIGAIELPQSRIKEINKLGRCLNSMVTSIKCAIEDRDQLFEEIKSEEEKHRTTLNSIADAVISTDTKGCIKSMNPAAEEITGWKQEEALNRDISEVYQVNPGSTSKDANLPFRRRFRTPDISVHLKTLSSSTKMVKNIIFPNRPP